MEPPKGNPPMESLPLNAAPVPVEAALRPDPDAPLVARAQAGEMEAFEKLVDRHGRRVYRMILGITGNESDAEDGAQNTFLKAYQKIGEFQGHSKFSSWLLRIAMNEGLEVLRRRRSKFNRNLDEWDAADEETFRPRSVRPWDENPEQKYSQAEVREIVEHLADCRPCKVVADSAQRTVKIITGCRSFELPAKMSARIMARIRAAGCTTKDSGGQGS